VSLHNQNIRAKNCNAPCAHTHASHCLQAVREREKQAAADRRMAEMHARDEWLADERRRMEEAVQAQAAAAATAEAERIAALDKWALQAQRGMERQREREAAPVRAAWGKAAGGVKANRVLAVGGLMTEVSKRDVGEVHERVSVATKNIDRVAPAPARVA